MSSVTEREGRHTELPWRAEGPDMFGDYNILHPADSLAVAAVVSNMRPGAEVAANAALIVKAVNAHDDLVAALRVTLRLAESWVRSELEGTSQYAAVMAELEPARAALSKAGAS